MPMFDEDNDERQTAGATQSPGRRRAAAYRRAIFDAVSPDEWRQTVAKACDEALEGDHRAREWILKLLGVDNVVKTQTALEGHADPICHSELLHAVEAGRAAKAAGLPWNRNDAHPADDDDGVDSRPAPRGLAAAYRQAIFDVVTPDKWRRIVAKARGEALAGDPRAREWILKLLGVEDVVEAQAEIDDSEGVVTINTLVREIKAGEEKQRRLERRVEENDGVEEVKYDRDRKTAGDERGW